MGAGGLGAGGHQPPPAPMGPAGAEGGGPGGFAARGMLGCEGFTRTNPRSDRFGVRAFAHVEFWCGDAQNTARRFSGALGMPMVARRDLSTGEARCSSCVLRSGDLTFVFTAPNALEVAAAAAAAAAAEDEGGRGRESGATGTSGRSEPCQRAGGGMPGYDAEKAHRFVQRHGLAVRAVGLLVDDAREAFASSVKHGARPALEPCLAGEGTGAVTVAEVELYGDAVLRFMSGPGAGARGFFPGYEALEAPSYQDFGLVGLDHVVGNVPCLLETVDYIARFTGFHEFAEFTAEDVGTVDSGLNSMVLASNNEKVLLPINEPTTGTRRKSQIQTYLDHNLGPGVQHLALRSNDILTTLTRMREVSDTVGFDFMPRPSEKYYRELPARIGDSLTPEQYREVERLGALVDKDDQGVLLQIFTKPLGDRPTIFIEIIQRVGCVQPAEEPGPSGALQMEQAGGCGGFGKGNFTELFKSIEDYERTLE